MDRAVSHSDVARTDPVGGRRILILINPGFRDVAALDFDLRAIVQVECNF